MRADDEIEKEIMAVINSLLKLIPDATLKD
jgi:hypothetical protein